MSEKLTIFLNPYIYIFDFTWIVWIACNISLFDFVRWNQIEIYYVLFILLRWNQTDIYMCLKKIIHTHDQLAMKKSILESVKDEKIHFVKCEPLWIELCKFWFDNFIFKKWSRARYVVDSSKKLVGNLGRDQIWSM